MTNEEAIQGLKDILEEATSDKDAVCYVTSEDAEALNMAIEALRTEVVRCGECKKQFTNNCYMIYGKNMMRNLFDNDFCSYGERREP